MTAVYIAQVQFPHCDSTVLHAPGVCRYCDRHPAWQQYRSQAGINFTGEQDPNKAPDPAEARRPLKSIERWHGNVPEKRTDAQINADYAAYWAEVNRLIAFGGRVGFGFRARSAWRWLKWRVTHA